MTFWSNKFQMKKNWTTYRFSRKILSDTTLISYKIRSTIQIQLRVQKKLYLTLHSFPKYGRFVVVSYTTFTKYFSLPPIPHAKTNRPFGLFWGWLSFPSSFFEPILVCHKLLEVSNLALFSFLGFLFLGSVWCFAGNMSCFFYFKEKPRPARGPEARRKSNESSSDRRDKSSGSAPSGESHATKSSTGSPNSSRRIPELYREKTWKLTAFPFSELRHATDNFSRTLKIGEGGFGSIYRGTITRSDGKGEEQQVDVAIKVLKRDSSQVWWLRRF